MNSSSFGGWEYESGFIRAATSGNATLRDPSTSQVEQKYTAIASGPSSSEMSFVGTSSSNVVSTTNSVGSLEKGSAA